MTIRHAEINRTGLTEMLVSPRCKLTATKG